MHTVTVAELPTLEPTTLGLGRWNEVSQQQVNQFADATGDHQWIHVDPERAATGPFGRTIAHGYLTLSLVPALLDEVLQVHDAAPAINYGLGKARFPVPVPVGSRVRLGAMVEKVEPVPAGYQVALAVMIDCDAVPSRHASARCSTASSARPRPPPAARIERSVAARLGAGREA